MGFTSSQVLKSSFLSLAIKFIQKSLGLLSTLILARVLTPDDFGIVAISAIVIHFCEALSTAGSESYLIQQTTLSDDDINSSWTLELCLKLSLWLILLGCIPFISDFYEQEELNDLLLLSSFILIINSLKSPGVALLKKELQYKPLFTLGIIQKLISFSIVMAIVYFSPSYWAIIIGDVASALVLMIGSYFIHTHRPRLCVKKIKQQFYFSKWILMKSVAGYSRAQMDVFFVGKLFSVEQLGAYNLARHLSIMPSTDIVAPAIEPLLASFSKVKHDNLLLNKQFYMSFFLVYLLITPLTVFMWFYPEKVIDLILGKSWSAAYELLSALSILLFTFSVGQIINPYLVAAGKVKAIFFYDVLSFIFVLIGLYYLHNNSLYDFAILRGVLSIIPLVVMLTYIRTQTKLSILKLTLLLSPIMLTSIFAVNITGFLGSYESGAAFIDFAASTAIFFCIYFLSLAVLYLSFYQKNEEWGKVAQAVSKTYHHVKTYLLKKQQDS